MRNLLIIIIAAIGLSSCGFKELSATQYGEVQLNGVKHSKDDCNYVDIYQRKDVYRFMFYQDDVLYNSIDTTSDDEMYKLDGVIHYLFIGTDTGFMIDTSPREISIYNFDAPVVTYTNKCEE